MLSLVAARFVTEVQKAGKALSMMSLGFPEKSDSRWRDGYVRGLRDLGYRLPLAREPDGKVEAERTADRPEFCLSGALTQYCSNNALTLAVEIDHLIER